MCDEFDSIGAPQKSCFHASHPPAPSATTSAFSAYANLSSNVGSCVLEKPPTSASASSGASSRYVRAFAIDRRRHAGAADCAASLLLGPPSVRLAAYVTCVVTTSAVPSHVGRTGCGPID